jgi:hypothetical protein
MAVTSPEMLSATTTVTAPAVLARPIPWVAGFASIGAGAIHAAAAGSHADLPDLRLAFTAAALGQIAWGVAVLRPAVRWWVASLGTLVNGAALVVWGVTRLADIPSIEGLEQAGSIGVADGIAAALAAIALILALPVLSRASGAIRWVTVPGAAMVLVASGIGVTQASAHAHAHGAGAGDDHHGSSTAPAIVPEAIPGSALAAPTTVASATAAATVTTAAAQPVVEPFSPDRPINLGGMTGVTRAENLLAATVMLLPQFADPAYAESQGFASIGDGATGHEHYINTTYMADDHILNPNYPESLVYDTSVRPKRLVSAMFMLNEGTPLAEAPDIGGALTQWHVHDNLCFDGGRVVGLTDAEGRCSRGSKGAETPMIHVWIEPHPCGPFASLEGIAAGSVLPGETHACDAVHGH